MTQRSWNKSCGHIRKWTSVLWARVQLHRMWSRKTEVRKTSLCEVFLLRSLSLAQFIRLSWITSDEKKVNKPLPIAFRNGTLDSNAGRNVKRSADVRGNARHFCDFELNYTRIREKGVKNHSTCSEIKKSLQKMHSQLLLWVHFLSWFKFLMKRENYHIW